MEDHLSDREQHQERICAVRYLMIQVAYKADKSTWEIVSRCNQSIYYVGINGKRWMLPVSKIKREANLRRLIAGFPLGALACCLCVTYTHAAIRWSRINFFCSTVPTHITSFLFCEIKDESLANVAVVTRSIVPVDPFSYPLTAVKVP